MFLALRGNSSEVLRQARLNAVLNRMKTAGLLTVVGLALLSAAMAQGEDDNELLQDDREPRTGGIIKSLLPYFNLKIKNPFECKPRSSVNGQQVLGTCMSQRDCDYAFGTVDGECASGYGRCCILYANCGETVERNRTYIVSNGTTSGFCSYTIRKERLGFSKTNKVAEAIGSCQVRLDFEDFVLGQPVATALPAPGSVLCSGDYFEITGNQNSPGRICGTNIGQHMYLPISQGSDTIATLNFAMSVTANLSVARRWRVRVTYIPCLSNMTAPPGCLQYYTGDTGTINSFNYIDTAAPLTPYEIGNLRYTICISERTGSCGLNISSTRFSVSGAAPTGGAAGTAVVGVAGCAVTGATTSVDYIQADLVGADGIPTEGIRCGSMLTPMTTYRRPFSIFVRTDSFETITENNFGFSLNYIRLPCTIF